MIIQIYRGDTPTITFSVTRNGGAVSLAGYSMWFTAAILPLSDNNSYLFNRLCDVNSEITNECTVTLSSLDSMTVGAYAAELSGIEGFGVNIITFGQWDLRISQDVRT